MSQPVLIVEFIARDGDVELMEESIPLHSPEELFNFISPGGGCESIPSDVDEIKMTFLPPEHPNINNPVADTPAMLQLGMVFFTGPLAEISRSIIEILDKAGRGELSKSFLNVIGVQPV